MNAKDLFVYIRFHCHAIYICFALDVITLRHSVNVVRQEKDRYRKRKLLRVLDKGLEL